MEKIKRHYGYDPEKHANPLYEFSLSKFYFIVHEGLLKIFKKHEETTDA